MSARARVLAGIVVLASVIGAGVAVVARDDTDDPSVIAPRQGAVTGCRAPDGSAAPTPDPALSRPASVTVPGGRSIDTGGVAPSEVVEPPNAAPWAVVRDAGAIEAPHGRIARVDVDGSRLAQVVEVVAGCDVLVLAAGDAALWAGTCDTSATSGEGAELVELDPADGAIRRRIAVPTTCVEAIAVSSDRVWAVSAATFEAPARVFRVDVAGGAVDEPLTLDPNEAILGIAADASGVWTSRRGPAEARVVRSDPATGTDVVAVPVSPSRVLGIVDGTLWTQDLTASAIVGRDAASGAPTVTVPVADLRLAAAGASGVWFEAAATGSLTVTVGRVDAAGAATVVVSYTGAGPDRTGLPFLGTLTATARGAWVATQDRLFLVAG